MPEENCIPADIEDEEVLTWAQEADLLRPPKPCALHLAPDDIRSGPVPEPAREEALRDVVG